MDCCCVTRNGNRTSAVTATGDLRKTAGIPVFVVSLHSCRMSRTMSSRLRKTRLKVSATIPDTFFGAGKSQTPRSEI